MTDTSATSPDPSISTADRPRRLARAAAAAVIAGAITVGGGAAGFGSSPGPGGSPGHIVADIRCPGCGYNHNETLLRPERDR